MNEFRNCEKWCEKLFSGGPGFLVLFVRDPNRV